MTKTAVKRCMEGSPVQRVDRLNPNGSCGSLANRLSSRWRENGQDDDCFLRTSHATSGSAPGSSTRMATPGSQARVDGVLGKARRRKAPAMKAKSGPLRRSRARQTIEEIHDSGLQRGFGPDHDELACPDQLFEEFRSVSQVVCGGTNVGANGLSHQRVRVTSQLGRQQRLDRGSDAVHDGTEMA